MWHMPTRTLKKTGDIFANVPVGRFHIVGGPSMSACQATQQELKDGAIDVEHTFTLRTDASEQTFYRKLRIDDIGDVRRTGRFAFTGHFTGWCVRGFYNPKTRQGWFVKNSSLLTD